MGFVVGGATVGAERRRPLRASCARRRRSRAAPLRMMAPQNGNGATNGVSAASSNADGAGVGAPAAARRAHVHRKTGETEVDVVVNVDGSGECHCDSGIPFLDHMIHQLCSHGLLDITLKAEGDYHIDDHHTNEDVGISLGMALADAVGAKKGIRRFGHFVAPLDEALVEVVLDFSGRPHLSYGLEVPTQRVGTYDTQLVREFLSALASNAQLTLHVRQLDGINSHHIIEASFKALARAMRMALEYDPRRLGQVPSSKGVLTDQQAARERARAPPPPPSPPAA